jgi:hypothetical protein
VAELNGRRIAAVLTADTNVKVGIYGLAEFDSHLHELADTGLVKLCERIGLEDLLIVVSAEELACVVT